MIQPRPFTVRVVAAILAVMKPISEIRRINLRRALKERSISQSELARKMGLGTPSLINQHVSGAKNIGERLARRYEVYIPLPAFDLDQSEPGARIERPTVTPVREWSSEDELDENYVFIPRLAVKASAGNGKLIWHVDEAGQREAFRSSWMQRIGVDPKFAATIQAEGQSMAPRIEDGDSLIVDLKSTTISSGRVYALTFSGELFIKRIFRAPDGGIKIVSDNQDKSRYPDWNVAPSQMDSLGIIARVVAVSGTM